MPFRPIGGAGTPSTVISRPPALPVRIDNPGRAGARQLSPAFNTRVRTTDWRASRIWIQLSAVARMTTSPGGLGAGSVAAGTAAIAEPAAAGRPTEPDPTSIGPDCPGPSDGAAGEPTGCETACGARNRSA